nr:sensor histidine kinase [Sulfobacillus harzensis]
MEEERRRFARDLHDGPVQVLSNTSMRLELLGRIFEADRALALQEMERIRRRLAQAVVEIRQLIYDLQPVALDAMGFIPSLHALAHRIQTDWGTVVLVSVDGTREISLASSQAIMLYRAVQEAATNAAKHARAQTIRIVCVQEPDDLRVTVMDDGVGFDAKMGSKPGHYGLLTMAERMRLMGGSVDIQSKPNLGTRIALVMPR